MSTENTKVFDDLIRQKAEELLALMLESKITYYSSCLSENHINISVSSCGCEDFEEGSFLCPECGERIQKNSIKIIKDFEVDNFENRNLLSEGFVYQCANTKKKIMVLIRE